MGREGAAWVKVVDLGGALDHNAHVCSSSERDSESSSSIDDEVVNTESSIKCVRLMAETEVVVIPKPRNHLQIKDTLSTMDFSAPTPIAMN